MDRSTAFGIATDAIITDALAENAIVAFSVSGGKDSAAATLATNHYLDALGHDRARRIIIHADLGRIEWMTTPRQVEALAARAGLDLVVVRRQAGDLITRWQQRFTNCKAPYESLTTYGLVGPWSSGALRFCTSELKTHVITAERRRRLPGQTVLSVVGLRRDESRSRAMTLISKLPGTAQRSAAGPRLINWHPLEAWSEAQVYAWHVAHRIPLHEAYKKWNASRMGCSFCVLASLHNLESRTAVPGNRATLDLLVDLEIASHFSFQPTRWLADLTPALLGARRRDQLAHTKASAIRRRQLEAGLPDGLRFERGWPPRIPTRIEAAQIAAVRAEILAQHALPNHFPGAAAVIDRFAELHAALAAA